KPEAPTAFERAVEDFPARCKSAQSPASCSCVREVATISNRATRLKQAKAKCPGAAADLDPSIHKRAPIRVDSRRIKKIQNNFLTPEIRGDNDLRDRGSKFPTQWFPLPGTRCLLQRK